MGEMQFIQKKLCIYSTSKRLAARVDRGEDKMGENRITQPAATTTSSPIF